MTKSTAFLIAAIATAPALAGCASIAPERQLERPADLSWSDYLASQPSVASTAVDERWWVQFGDPVLTGLIDQAASSNINLAIANSRLAEARASRRAAIAQFGPRVDLAPSVTAQRQSKNGALPVGSIPGFKAENVIFDAGFDASWELDFFGRNDSRRRQANADVAARQAERDDALVSLLSEVARNYFELRLSQGEKAIAQQKVALEQERFNMIMRQREVGEASDANVTQETALLSSRQAEIPRLDGQIRSGINAIAILLGQSPADMQPRLKDSSDLPAPPAVIASGLTSDLLRRRPDVRAAEYRYAAAESGRRLSDLALYPTFALLGSGGFESTNLTNLFDPASIVANIGALLSWSLYDGGRKDAERTAAAERSNQAALAYRGEVLGALAEVETGAARYVEAGRQVRDLSQALKAREQQVDYSLRRFEAGTNNRFDVISARKEAADAERALLDARAGQLLALVSFHKALGGGWRSFETEEVTSPSP